MDDVRDFKLTIADAQENPSAFTNFFPRNENVSHAVTFFTVNCKCNKTQTKFLSLLPRRTTSTEDTQTTECRHATRRRIMENFKDRQFSLNKKNENKPLKNLSLGREDLLLFQKSLVWNLCVCSILLRTHKVDLFVEKSNLAIT